MHHFDHVAVRCLCSSLPGIASHCLCTTYRCCSLPLLCNTSLFLSYAFYLLAMPLLLNSSHVIATQYRCASTHSALCRCLSLLRRPLRCHCITELCLCLAIPPLLRNTIASRFYSSLCHCHATLRPCGAYFGVAHRSGSRNMALAYRLHHNQVWQLPHDGADDVDLVRIRIRVPDSVTDLDSLSPPFDRHHGPCNISIR